MLDFIGGPDRDRTDDLFHAMEARSQLRHRPTLWEGLVYCRGCGEASQTIPKFREQLDSAQCLRAIE